jgi:hypothetical protein
MELYRDWMMSLIFRDALAMNIVRLTKLNSLVNASDRINIGELNSGY